MTLPNWLETQVKNAKEEKEKWPSWMQKNSDFEYKIEQDKNEYKFVTEESKEDLITEEKG